MKNNSTNNRYRKRWLIYWNPKMINAYVSGLCGTAENVRIEELRSRFFLYDKWVTRYERRRQRLMQELGIDEELELENWERVSEHMMEEISNPSAVSPQKGGWVKNGWLAAMVLLLLLLIGVAVFLYLLRRKV